MAFECEVVPRSDLTPEELKALGQAVQTWCGVEAGRLAAGWDRRGLEDLLAGEMPRPALLLYLQELDDERRQDDLPPLTGTERQRELRRLAGLDEELPGPMRALRARLLARRVLRLRVHTSLDSTARLRDGSVVRECVEGGVAHDRTAAIASLRQALPEELLEDVIVNGLSWSWAG
jgi:hypothetical protein